jgi:putative ABC transport system permease protein
MIRHWLTIAWRTVRGDPAFAAISILSLAIGCAGALLVGAYLREELTFDHWIPGSERIVRLDTSMGMPGQEPRVTGLAPGGIGFRLADELEGKGTLTRIAMGGQLSVRNGETRFDIPTAYVDPNFFEVIALPLSEGDPETALSDPSNVVISQATRAKLFGAGPALGQTLTITSGGRPTLPGATPAPPRDVDVIVSGVLAPPPRNTQFRFELMGTHAAPFGQGLDAYNRAFNMFNGPTFIKADSVETARAWRESLPPIAAAIFDSNVQRPPGMPAGQGGATFGLTPLRDAHLSPNQAFLGPSGNVPQLQLFATVAGALLFVSAFNYVSLSLARVVRRTREVGLRKAMGAMRGDLVRQHIAESALFTLMALLIGFGLAELVRPWFSRAVNIGLEAAALHHPSFLALALAGGAGLAILVAAYPAAYLSGLRPSSILQGRTGSSRALAGGIFALVAVQFAAATALVTAVAVFYAQARFIANTPLGYEEEGLYALNGGIIMIMPSIPDQMAQENQTRLSRLRASLAGAPGVISVSGASWATTVDLDVPDLVRARIVNPGQLEEEAGRALVDWIALDYFETMGMKTIAGRGFDESLGGDRIYLDNPAAKPAQLPAVITRAALPLFGATTPEEALGRRARAAMGMGPMATSVEIEVVGVTDDFHYRSLKHPVDPFVFLPNPGGSNMLYARIDPAEREAAVAALEAAVKEVFPNRVGQILDHELLNENRYAEERSWRRVVSVVAALAVAVACLGLYGLTAFSANQRRREVGVRKALGADEGDVLRLMLARFARPVLAGVGAGWLVAYFAMANWLQGYAYHVPLTAVPFVIAGLAALVVAGVTALFHALRAARTSPAIVLRAE